MLKAYKTDTKGLTLCDAQTRPDAALWIDLFTPTPEEAALVGTWGVGVPSLAEMEEIEVSNRIYREDNADYITVVLPGLNAAGDQISGPVCFVLMAKRLITVRHHAPRPFETYPERASQTNIGCALPETVFLGLVQEVIGRLADQLEGVGRGLDEVTRKVYQPDPRSQRPVALQRALVNLGHEGERLNRVRLGLMTLARGLNHFGQSLATFENPAALAEFLTSQLRDAAALEVHADFLSQRLALASDATLGMINLAQNGTVRIVSVVAVLFLPPTLIASIYGMNFALMPELAHPLGYPMALGMMLASALLAWAFFRWRGWL